MKEKIIQSAINLFITLGFKSVTMDDIASEIGISKKTIYTHFKNKTELVKATTVHLFESISAGIDEICTLDSDPIDELYRIKRFVMIALKDEQSSPQHQLQKYYPEIANAMQAKKFDVMAECTLNNLKKGMEQGLYRADIDVNFVSRIYFVGINGIKDDTLFPIQEFPKVKVHEDYLEYHLRGIVTPEGLKTLNKFIKTKQ
jgi:AcrR family transcriptional regulator